MSVRRAYSETEPNCKPPSVSVLFFSDALYCLCYLRYIYELSYPDRLSVLWLVTPVPSYIRAQVIIHIQKAEEEESEDLKLAFKLYVLED